VIGRAPDPAGVARRAPRWLAVAAWLGPAAVLAWWVAVRLGGERWWPTTLVLYLPHGLLLPPLAALGLLVALRGERWRLLPLAAAAWLLLFPVMGLRLGGPRAPTPGAPRLRLLTCNVDAGGRSLEATVAEIAAAGPDLVALQESTPEVAAALRQALPGLEQRAVRDLLVASRSPNVELLAPPPVAAGGQLRSPRFMRVTLDTPLGPIDLLDVHPISPREVLESARGDGFLVELRGGSLPLVDPALVRRNTELRRAQVAAIAAVAGGSTRAVLLAGDTNLPQGSPLLAAGLGRWRDAFDEVGRGLGYTFPVGPRKLPWMRIDRILAGPGLRFLAVAVGAGRGSDHHCVWADLEASPD